VKVNLIKENDDGSADFSFDLNSTEMGMLLNLGILTAIKNGIEEGEKYEPSETSLGDTERGESDSVHGSGEQSREPEQHDLFPETLEVPNKA